MRKHIPILSFMLTTVLISCKSDNEVTKFFKQIEGSWQLESSNTFEIWQNNNGSFTAKVVEIHQEDTTILEKITIIEEDSDIFYEALAYGQNNNQLIRFKMIELTNSAITFENKKHDFPQKISYKIIDPFNIVATISGDSKGEFKEIDFNYSKTSNIKNKKNGVMENQVEALMEELPKTKDSATEAKLLNNIWEFSRPEVTRNPMSLHLSATDSLGNQVIANLSSAKGKVTVRLTMSNKENWRKTIDFTPCNLNNVYLLMRE